VAQQVVPGTRAAQRSRVTDQTKAFAFSGRLDRVLMIQRALPVEHVVETAVNLRSRSRTRNCTGRRVSQVHERLRACWAVPAQWGAR